MASGALFSGLCVSMSCFAALTAQADAFRMVFEFEPMGAMNTDLSSPAGSLVEFRAKESPAEGGQEAELDELLSTVLLPPTMINEAGGQPEMISQGQNYQPLEDDVAIKIEEREDSEIRPLDFTSPEAEAKNLGNSIFGTWLRDLLPGPLGSIAVQERHPQPFSVPDPFVLNILQDFDRSFADEVVPATQKSSSQEGMPKSCEQDIAAKCQHARSHLHCLGYNHDNISADCKRDVGHSVPFLCSLAIDKWCDDWNDPLELSVLSCLHGYLENLNGKCRDAVVTTQHVINKAKTQKAIVVDPATGEKRVSIPEVTSGAAVPSAARAAAEHEADLDAKLGITPAVKTKRPEASSFATGPAQAPKLDPQSSFGNISMPVLAVLFLSVIIIVVHLIIGFAAYTIACQGSRFSSRSEERLAFARQKAPVGIKLADSMEMPKSRSSPEKHCMYHHVV
mmetsp:Transcript_104270/g.183760  ORF Transcript_104270/g.183760 Transcript_104270/m.183760 type:complete len:451 (+) Transcript_104270:70-1422(+)